MLTMSISAVRSPWPVHKHLTNYLQTTEPEHAVKSVSMMAQWHNGPTTSHVPAFPNAIISTTLHPILTTQDFTATYRQTFLNVSSHARQVQDSSVITLLTSACSCVIWELGVTLTITEVALLTVTNGTKWFTIRRTMEEFVSHTVKTGLMRIGITGIVKLMLITVLLESMAVIWTTLVWHSAHKRGTISVTTLLNFVSKGVRTWLNWSTVLPPLTFLTQTTRTDCASECAMLLRVNRELSVTTSQTLVSNDALPTVMETHWLSTDTVLLHVPIPTLLTPWQCSVLVFALPAPHTLVLKVTGLVLNLVPLEHGLTLTRENVLPLVQKPQL